MSSPLFSINQRVKRLEHRPVVGAVVLDFIQTNETVVYHIQYDEGPEEGRHDGTGWWNEDCLESETLADIKARLGVE